MSSIVIDSIVSICHDIDDTLDFKSELQSSKAIDDFVEEPNETTLHIIIYTDSHVDVLLDLKSVGNKKSTSGSGSILTTVIFVKRINEKITKKNFNFLVDIHKLQDSPIDGLYKSVRDVWCPALLNGGDCTDTLAPRVQQLLTQLELSLSNPTSRDDINAIDLSSSSSSKRSDGTLKGSGNINELNDELMYWLQVSKEGSDNVYTKNIYHHIYNIIALFDTTALDTFDFSSITDNITTSLSNSLIALWGLVSKDGEFYHQSRMSSLIDIIGGNITRCIQRKLSSNDRNDVWNINDSESRNLLQSANKVCMCMHNLVHRLTSSVWSINSSTSASSQKVHVWEGKPHDDTYFNGFRDRLETIVRVRFMMDEIYQLLPRNDIEKYQLNDILNDIKGVKPLLYNQYTNNYFLTSVKEFDKRVEATVGSLLCSHLKRTLAPYLDNDHELLLKELYSYRYLGSVEFIRTSIHQELNVLMTLQSNTIKKMSQLFDKLVTSTSSSSSSSSSSSNSESIEVSSIRKMRDLHIKVASMVSMSERFLHDMKGYHNYKAACDELLCRLKTKEEALAQAWMDKMRSKIDMKELNFDSRNADTLLKWSDDGLLLATISDNVLHFLNELSILQDLHLITEATTSATTTGSGGGGGAIANEIIRSSSASKSYLNYMYLLTKLADFYNSVIDSVIPTQRTLLNTTIAKFVSLVKVPMKVSKSTATSVLINDYNNHIRILQEAVEKLSIENKWLRRFHRMVTEQTTTLMTTDLLTNTETWKSNWKLLKESMKELCSKYSDGDTKPYLLHWDHQVYKALEVNYQMGLVSLNEHLSDISVELTYSKLSLEYKPALESIRQQYYNETKKFMSMPNNFDGFSRTSGSIYKAMSKRNMHSIIQVYTKAEFLFDQLHTLMYKYAPWTDISSMDHGSITKPSQYVDQFKYIDDRRRAIDASIPDVERIGCCTISLVTFKVILNELYLRAGDNLLISLRRNLLVEFKAVDQYLDTASDSFRVRPTTVDEIGVAKKCIDEYEGKVDHMLSVSKLCHEKMKLLISYAPGTAVDIIDVTARMSNLDGEGGRWDDFYSSLSAYKSLVEEQKQIVKGTIDEDVVSLNAYINKFANRWRTQKPSSSSGSGSGNSSKSSSQLYEYSDASHTFTLLDDWNRQFTDISQRMQVLSDSCDMFNITLPSFDGYESLKRDMVEMCSSWSILRRYYDELKALSDQDWLAFSTNIYALQDFANAWVDKLVSCQSSSDSSSGSSSGTTSKGKGKGRGSSDGSSTAPSIEDGYVSEFIRGKLSQIKKSIPTLTYCRGEPFKEDHWNELLQGKLLLPKDVKRENVKVDHFLSRLDILNEPSTLTFVKNLQTRALGEVQIREALQELRAWERSAEIKILTVEESGRRLPLIKDWKDIFIEMGDKQSLLGSLKESQYFVAFQDQGSALEAKMASLDFSLHTLNAIQRKWLYLEPIFGKGSLPAEESRFRRVDEDLTDILNLITRDPKLFYLTDEQIHPHLNDKLRTMLDQLERCQKALADYLEAKRSSMPRFYFIGDDDLLEILGQSKNPTIIQSHLKKLFQGVHKVKFNKECTQITAMVSSSNETVELETSVAVSEKVEEWLHLLAKEMRSTLATLLKNRLRGIKGNAVSSSDDFDLSDPSQIICLAECIRFTKGAEDAIESRSVAEYMSEQKAMLRLLTSKDFSDDTLKLLKMKALVLDIVHNIDVLEQLLKHNVTSLNDWYWKKQLRYYYEHDKASVRMHDATFDYTYEYQGNAPKLVHTPLTDKCYLTLTQGMHMGFGGNPYGPAGTGKTESVKALASCMGRQVLVFNCDEALESSSMVRIFVGIVKCGAWGCFDEFNRLKEDQLSAISQQIQTIQDAIKTKTSPIQLLGKNIDVNFNSGIFVTLNPAGKGYGGRSRLPDNLKALFRPVAMGAPDNEIIAEVSLVTEGFTQSKDLASKIVSLFRLSRQLLSNQQHYDWGLRALKAVLNSGGRLIQSHKANGESVTNDMEYEILIKAVRVNTLSKLTYDDTNKFLSLITDVFPGILSADISGGELEEAIRLVMSEKPFFLSQDPMQIKKMIQLKESLDQRMGCVIVGPSGCGKSSLWRVLKAAMIKCGQPVITHVMNPKSMERERLLGYMDMDTREWSDGVLTDAARKVVKESPDVKCWIICDGDVDPEWIESLNSVLDDNHLLTMPNGERISFGPNINFLFETHDLKFASPATVSRMGMIFLSDEDLDITRIVQRWISSLPTQSQQLMSNWVTEIFHKAFHLSMKYDKIVDTTLVGIIMNGLSQIKKADSRSEFISSIITGLGGNMSVSNRVSYAKEIFSMTNERPPDIGAPLDCYGVKDAFVSYQPPSRQSSSSCGSSGNEHAEITDIGNKVVIPTVSVQRTLSVIDTWIASMEPFILVGPEGCGKSMIINHAYRKHRNISVTTLHCNAQTTAQDVINKIAQTCSLYSSPDGRVYRPKDCERLVLYLKDINLPKPDMYDTCQLIAFLQQIVTFDGFYDDALEFLRIERVQIVASMNAATTVGRSILSTRFTAIVRILIVDYPDTTELLSVYDAFLHIIYSSNARKGIKINGSNDNTEKISRYIVEVYQETREKLTSDDQRHYLFTPRDITLLVKNLCRYDLTTESIVNVIHHESCRIFRDRLVSVEACDKFNKLLDGVLQINSRAAPMYSSLMTCRFAGKSGSKTKKSSDSNESKGDDSTTDDDSDPDSSHSVDGRQLSRVTESELKQLVIDGLVYYEREECPLGLHLIPEIIERIAQIDRILSSNCGHMLLVGRTGMCRRDMIKIISYMLGYEIYTPAIGRDYTSKQFIADVKIALLTAGIKGEHCILLIEDYQITSDATLEIVNSLVSSGEVPGLYTQEELDPLLSPLRERIREKNIVGYRTPYEYFISRIRQYLHVVLIMDHTHARFAHRCESNPAIYGQCSVVWIGEYRQASLKTIPTLMDAIKDLLHTAAATTDVNTNADGGSSRSNDRDLGKHDDDDDEAYTESKSSVSDTKSTHKGGRRQYDSDTLINMIVSIHNSCSSLGATPKDYVEFLRNWYRMYEAKSKELVSELHHLQAGLSKLDNASEVVNDLRTNAAQQEKDLRIAQTAADRAMDEISKALTSANDRKNEVAQVKRAVAENEEVTKERKGRIESELAEIQPILDSAKQAVGSIKSEHLNEIRSLTAPPEAIADVLAAVLMLLGVQDLSWLSMKKFLSNRGVKDDILNYDARRIDVTLRNNVSKLIKKKATSFDAANIQRVSIAAAPMAAWVKANIKYSIVLEKIEPLQADLTEEIDKLESSQRRLEKCEEELKDIDQRVAILKTEFGNRTAEAERLQRNLAIAGTTLDKAERLIGQLSGEQQRWKVQGNQLKDDVEKLVIKMMMSAGFVTYLTKTSEDVRSSMIHRWLEITGVKHFTFKRAMGTETQLLQWKNAGLPSDDLSQENSLAVINTSDRIPFIIDPASVATAWLKSILSSDKTRPLECVTNHDPRFTTQVELAVRFGKTLLVTEVDGIEPMLYSLVRKDLIKQGTRYVVTVGEKKIDYSESFRLILITRNPEPDLAPDASSIINQINYTVTRGGLEAQLLGIAIQHEQPELEKAKGEMLRKEEDFKVQLASLEKNLLQALATAEGNLLENTMLIESLTRTKEKSAEIEVALTESAAASRKLDKEREEYRGFAVAGSKLFFLVKSLQLLSHMYRFSLNAFLVLFTQTLHVSVKAKDTEHRLQLLCEDLQVRLLYFIGRGLFKADRLTYALHLVKGMNSTAFGKNEWEVFTGSLIASVTNDSRTGTAGFPSWASSERQAHFRLLSEYLPSLASSLDLDSSSKWSSFASSTEAEKKVPSSLSAFQKVLIVQCLRPDRLQSAIQLFCNDMLKVESISPPNASLAALCHESDSTTPLLLISSPGADPSKELQEHAAKTIGLGQYEELAMGGGQQDVAIHMLRSAAQSGTWLCLKNLHLVVTWLPTLEKELSSLSPQQEFRLWLTSEAHSHFPKILLQLSLKSTYESPPGLKQNLHKAINSWDRSMLDECSRLKARLLYLLASFHSVIQERRTYIPQGWSKFYEFSFGDMRAGMFVIDAITSADSTSSSSGSGSSKSIDWETIHGLMEDAIYGGRIDNAFDMRILRSYLKMFFCDRNVSSDRDVDIIPNTQLVMPYEINQDKLQAIVAQLPESDPPLTFCLPDNIERSLQRTTSMYVINNIRSLSAVEFEVSRYDRDKWRAQLSPMIELWQQVTAATPDILSSNKRVHMDKARDTAVGNSSSVDPVQDFICMEFQLACDLCGIVDNTLCSLKKVLFGSGLLTPAIQAAAMDLLSSNVPKEWKGRWDGGPEQPQKWFREVVRKYISLNKRRTLRDNMVIEEPLSLGDLFHPVTYINALRQLTARKLNTAIDRMKMICAWGTDSRQLSRSCKYPCVLKDMLLQGASFIGETLEESAPDAHEMSPVAQVTIGFVSNTSPDTYAEDESVYIPIYQSPSREEYIMQVQMPADTRLIETFILAGVALFLGDDV